jgi:IgA Peptidase M64
MTTADGNVLNTITVVNHGLPSQRWNLLVMGDGYRQAEIIKYSYDVENFINKLKDTKPFDRLWNAINVYRIDIASTDSGADDPVACGGTGVTPATYFDATFCSGGIQRALTVNNTTAIILANNRLPEWDMILVLVNSPIYGGTGGGVAVSSTHSSASEIVIHEIGHTAFGLADEYESYAGCGSGELGHDVYVGPEPFEPNVTINTDRNTNKWRHLILPTTPMPTTSNADCTQCDSQLSPVPEGTVGTFEGAQYFHCGKFRPEFNCKMRALGFSFCAVCQEIIQNTFSPYLIPVTQIRITITTGDKDINENDRVYLGIAGREFRCRRAGDSDANPFHLKNETVTLRFGGGSNVEEPAINDPRDPFIDVVDISNFPVYVRTEPNTGEWEIVAAKVETSPPTSIFTLKYPKIILDDDSGERVDLV